MIERQLISEPFDCMAFDLMGLCRRQRVGLFLIKSICMATRWPEVIALRTITAMAIAEGMIKIFVKQVSQARSYRVKRLSL